MKPMRLVSLAALAAVLIFAMGQNSVGSALQSVTFTPPANLTPVPNRNCLFLINGKLIISKSSIVEFNNTIFQNLIDGIFIEDTAKVAIKNSYLAASY